MKRVFVARASAAAAASTPVMSTITTGLSVRAAMVETMNGPGE